MPGGGSKPGQRRGGRKPGTPNKVTVSVKAALVEAFDQLGGVTSLVDWAKGNPTEFYKLWAKLAPTEIKVEGESRTVTEVIVRTREEASVVLALLGPPPEPVRSALPEAG